MDIFLSRTDTGQARWNAETFAVPIYSPAEAGPPGVHQQRQRRGRRSSAGKAAWQRQGKIQAARGSWQRCRAPLAARCQGEEEATRRGWRRCQTRWAAGEVGPPARRLLGTEEGKEEKVIDVEEDGDVAAEEQELDSVEEVGRLPTTALTRETMESPRRAGRREKRQKEKDNGKAKALVKLLEGKQEKKKKKEKKCTKKKKRVKKESPSGDSCPGSSGPSSPAQRCWHLSKSARQRGRAQS